MSGKVWMSSMTSNHAIFNKQGLRSKFFGQEWKAASHILDAPNDEQMAILNKYTKGIRLEREEMVEAAAVFDQKCFKKTHDLFAVGGFYAAKERLAAVFSRFDWGDGGLVPLTIYQADLETPLESEFFLLNFGAHKNSILPEQCEDARKFYVDKSTGQQVWDINYFKADGVVSLSSAALSGPDIWYEDAVYNKIFMSDALAAALREANLADDWRLHECQVGGGR